MSFYFDKPIVDEESYLRLLSQLFLPILPTLPGNPAFLQDGVPAGYSSQVMLLLDTSLPGFEIGRRRPLSVHFSHQTSRLSTSSCKDL